MVRNFKKIIDPEEDVISFDELYRRLTIVALEKHKGCARLASSEIGITKRTMSRFIKQYGLALKEFKN